ncbi:MAG: S-layer protein [Candidatus Diapherotrites archaeon]|nr:S-layer protein [Candidatus Diapherotrites archaeon]
MKSTTIKKVAAVAAGTAMLAGAVFAATIPTLEKSFFWDDNGNVNVQIVVGSNAAASDAIAAANLAAVIGSKAYVAAGEEVTVEPTVTGEAKIKVTGTATTPSEGTYVDDPANDPIDTGVNNLALGEAHGMYKGTLTYNDTDYDYKESVEVKNIKLKYEEDKDHHGIYFENTGGVNKIFYKFDFIKNFPIPEGKLTKTAEIRFLGTDYVINELKSDKIVLVKGAKKTLGIGQSTDETIGDNTYTVKLVDAAFNEETNKGEATVEVTKPDGTTTKVQLDTSSDRDATIGDMYIYLQSVAKSYTPGLGGTATFRIGGEKLTLENAMPYPNNEDWKVKIYTADSGSKLDYIKVYLNKNYGKDDKMTEIVGPENYFTIKYDGTQADRGEIEVDKVKFTGTEDDEKYVIKEITYTDEYENEYTVELWDSTHNRNRVFLATGGAIVGYHQGDETYNATGYLPLRPGDYFIVKEQPVKVNSIVYKSADPSQSKIKLNGVEYDFADCSSAPSPKGDPDLTNDTTGYYFGFNSSISGAKIICKDIIVSVNQGTQSVGICITSDDYAYYDDPIAWIKTNADSYVNSDYYTLQWTNPTYNASASANDYIAMGNTSVLMNLTTLDAAPTSLNISYIKSGDYEGIRVHDGADNRIDQAREKASEDRYKYHMWKSAMAEATDTSTVEIKVPKEVLKLRTILSPGEVVTTEPGVTTVTTADTFPYEVSTGVSVEELTCTAEPVTYTTGYTFGEVGKFVVDDMGIPTGNAIVVGGHLVNQLAVGVTEDKLTAAGDQYVDLVGNTLYVAGYTAADTAAAVDDLIAAIKAL